MLTSETKDGVTPNLIDAAYAAAQASMSRTFSKAHNRFLGVVPKDFAIGAGLIASKVRFPVWRKANRDYLTVSGTVLVLTHECDIDAENERPFNDMALLCPLIPFDKAVLAIARSPEFNKKNTERLIGYFANVAAAKVNQLIYFPAIDGADFSRGALMYLNQISHTSRDQLTKDVAAWQGVLTSEAFIVLDEILRRHFLRPKADKLPFESR